MAQESESPTITTAARWPVTPFKSLLNLVERFADGVPPRIDRSVLGGSEGQKTQLISALRFVGFITETNEILPVFTRFLTDDKERPKIVKEALARLYPAAAKLAAINATAAQYAETFAPYQADTLRKAMTFYYHAAKFSGHSLSKNFKVQRVARSTAKKARNSGATPEPPPMPASGNGVGTPSSHEARFLDLLMDRAAKAEGEEAEKLFDRIEKLLRKPEAGPLDF